MRLCQVLLRKHRLDWRLDKYVRTMWWLGSPKQQFWKFTDDEMDVQRTYDQYHDHSVRTIWKHRSEEDLDDWYTLDDNMYGGRSLVELSTGKGGRLQMKGVIDGSPSYNQPDANPWENTGFAGIRSYPFKSYWGNTYFGSHSIGVQKYDQFEIRCRGDGRRYRFQLHFRDLKGIPKMDANFIHRAILHTRGGPYWERVYIPYNRFFLMNRANIAQYYHTLPNMAQLYSVSIFPEDYLPGDFNLEIDSIRVVKSFAEENKTGRPEIMKYQKPIDHQLCQERFGQYRKSRVYSKQDNPLW